MSWVSSPELDREGRPLGSFPAEAAPKTKVDARHHIDGEVNGASRAETISSGDTAAHLQVNNTGNEASTAPISSTEKAMAENDVNDQREAPTAPNTGGDLPPQDMKTHHEPALVAESANGHVTVTPNPLVSNDIREDAVIGDRNCNFTKMPTPLTEDHQDEPIGASVKGGQLDDVWSPATKLKHRLRDTQNLIVCPGVYDGFSARIALSVGFDAMYMVRLRSLERLQ